MTPISKLSLQVIPHSHLYNVFFSYPRVAVSFYAPIHHALRSGGDACWQDSHARRSNRVEVLEANVGTGEGGIFGEFLKERKFSGSRSEALMRAILTGRPFPFLLLLFGVV